MANWILSLGYIIGALVHLALFIWVMMVLERHNASWGWRLWLMVIYVGLMVLFLATFWEGK